jgi:hypothetical protein
MELGEQSQWKKLWGEVGPLVNHALAVLILQVSLLLIGLVTRLLELLFPQQEDSIHFIGKIDVWTSLIALSLFASYTVILVAIRLTQSI